MMKTIHCDVVVCGGGPSGIAAAIAAARQGADTLLLEKNAYVGGCAASGLPFLNFFNKKQQQVIKGIAQELVERLQAENAALPHIRTSGGHVDSITMIDPEWMKMIAEELLTEAGCRLLYHTTVCEAQTKDDRLTSITIANKGGLSRIEAGCFIDATGDGDLAAFAGAEFAFGREEDGYTQAMSLVFRLAGVEVEKVSARFPKSPIVTMPLGADCAYNIHVTGKLTEWNDILREAGLFDHDGHDLWGGTVRHNELTYVNTTRVSKLDATDPEELTEANIQARRQMKGMVRFFNRYIDGMQNAYILSVPNGIGIRETRRVCGVYTLTEQDVLEGRKFEDSIARNGYCIDIHDPTGKSWGATFIKSEDSYYNIPYRCLVPAALDGLLVSGRCISATHKALGSVRIMPPCMATGEAAGIAAAIAVKRGLAPRAVSVAEVQAALVKSGALV